MTGTRVITTKLSDRDVEPGTVVLVLDRANQVQYQIDEQVWHYILIREPEIKDELAEMAD